MIVDHIGVKDVVCFPSSAFSFGCCLLLFIRKIDKFMMGMVLCTFPFYYFHFYLLLYLSVKKKKPHVFSVKF